MPLIESEQIELIDLTDSRPAFLSLSTSLPKMQTEERNVFSPDYTNEKTPQIITPTLFLGQEKIDIKEVLKKDPIKYSINPQQEIGNSESSEIYVSDNCLYIKKNLDASSWTITATIASLNYKGSQYQNITAETELFKVSGSTKQFLALLSSSDNRSFFEPTNRSEITLTANLYFGTDQYNGEVNYQWYKNGAAIKDKTTNKYTVTINDVQAMSNYHCSITTTDVGDKYLTPSITIMDKTDPYSAQIISSKGLIFSTDNDETELDCRVYQSNKELISSALTYKWYKEAIIKGNELNKNDKGEIENKKKIDVRPQDENTTEVTYYCVAKINETEIVSQITLMVAPRFNTIITPKQIFVPFIGDKYNGANSYKMQFYLQFLKAGSTNVPINKLEHDINLGDVEKYFSCFLEGEEIIFKKQENENLDWSNFPDSSICSIYYTYNGIQLQEEFYFIKSIAGAQPTISYAYWRGNTAEESEVPKDNNEITPDYLKWQSTITAANTYGQGIYLWTRITISYNDDRKVTTYSFTQDGLNIAKLVLQPSRPQVQIQKGDGSFEPDYSDPEKPQIITPLLYIGQESVSIPKDGISYSGYSEEEIDDFERLIISENLSKNTTQIITGTIETITHNGITYTDITDQIELTCLTSTSETNLQLTASSEAFTNDTQSIELTAKMYHEGKEVEDVIYTWYKNGVVINNETGTKLIVKKGDVQSVAIFSCQVLYQENIYKDEITINDFSDPYTSTITSSSGVIFTSANSLPTLTCRIYKGMNLIGDEDSEKITYQWYTIDENNTISDIISEKESITLEDIDLSAKSITFLCRATITEAGGHDVAVDAVLTLAIMGEISIKISPEVTFLPFNPAGEYTGDITNDSYEIKCSVVDSLGRVINKSNIGSFKIDLPEGITEASATEDENKAEYIYTVKMTSNVQNLKDSNTGAFTIVYNIGGAPSFSENFYFIKNIEGARSTISYAYWRGNTADEDKVKELPENSWSQTIPSGGSDPKNPYLWTRITISYNDGRSDTVTYSVMQDGFDGKGIDRIDYWYKWSNSGDTWPKPGPNYTENGIDQNGWTKDSIPENTSSLKYLWVKTMTIIVDKFGEESYSETNARDGVDGTSITKIDYDYIRSKTDNIDDVRDKTWYPNISAANDAISESDKKDYVFLWTRIETTLSVGDPKYSYSVVKDGSNVNAIDHIEYYYARSNSKENPPSSGWEKNISSTNKDLPYLWQKTVIIYTGKGADPTESYMVVEDGNVMTDVTVEYLYSSDASKNPDDSAADNNKPKPTWHASKAVAADKNSKNYPYLWTKTTYAMNKGGSKISYSVSDRNKIIKSTEELYAVGIKASGTIIEDSITKIIDLSILFNCNRLTWERDVPRYGQDGEGKSGDLDDSDTIKVIITPVKDKNTTISSINLTEEESLWMKYIFTYDDNSTGESEPFPINAFDDFRRSAYYVEVLRNDSSIQSIVGKKIWGGEVQTLESYLTQLPEKIQASIVIDDKYATYFTLHSEGLIIGKNTSNYTTFIDNDGFNIHYYEKGYDPEQPNNNYKVVGTFDANGLNTKQISLQDLSNSNSKIVVKGTETGGWSWVKGG